MSKIKAADDRCPEVVIGTVHRREVEMLMRMSSMAMIWLALVWLPWYSFLVFYS